MAWYPGKNIKGIYDYIKGKAEPEPKPEMIQPPEQYSFEKAFKEARQNGLPQFEYEGKMYHTRTEEEEYPTTPQTGELGPGASEQERMLYPEWYHEAQMEYDEPAAPPFDYNTTDPIERVLMERWIKGDDYGLDTKTRIKNIKGR